MAEMLKAKSNMLEANQNAIAKKSTLADIAKAALAASHEQRNTPDPLARADSDFPAESSSEYQQVKAMQSAA